MNHIVKFLLVSSLLALGGCMQSATTSNFQTISTHSLQVTPDRQTDVVWLQRYNNGQFELMRCQSEGGAACVRVATP